MPFLPLLLLITLSSLPSIGLSTLLLVPSHQHLALDLGRGSGSQTNKRDAGRTRTGSVSRTRYGTGEYAYGSLRVGSIRSGSKSIYEISRL